MSVDYRKLIQDELTEYEARSIEVVPGLYFNHKNTLERILFYYMSKFQTGAVDEFGDQVDDEGDKKYFYNIVRNPCKVMTKMIDFDTKNIRIVTAGGGDPLQTWFFERDLKFWMKDKNFGKTLNRIFQELPIFGSVVIKIIKNKPYFVDLRNFRMMPNADSLDDSPYIIERHLYTITQLRKVGKEMGWKNVEEAIKKFQSQKKRQRYIEVYERYGEVTEEVGEGDYKITNKRVFWANVGDENNERGEMNKPQAGQLLDETDYDGHPYYEFHLEKLAGRWLGVGIVEMLFDPQVRQNEMANQMSKLSYAASLFLWQQAGDETNQNLATDVVNFQVMDNGGNRIEKVDMTIQNIGFFTNEFQKWAQNQADLTFAYDVTQGERLPAGTPLGSAQLAASMAGNYFEHVQENIALVVKEMLLEDIIPNFQKEATPEHVLRIAGTDLDQVHEMIINQKANDSLLRFVLQNARFPDSQEYEVIKMAITEAVKQKKEELLTIPKNFYKDIAYKVDIDITGESMDTRVKAATLFAILQAITADPTILQDPSKRKLLVSWAEQGGVNIADIEAPKPQSMQDMIPGRAGGGVSAPQMGAPVQGSSTQTV